MAHGSRIHCHDRSMYTPIDRKMQEENLLFFLYNGSDRSVLGKNAPLKAALTLGSPLEKKT